MYLGHSKLYFKKLRQKFSLFSGEKLVLYIFFFKGEVSAKMFNCLFFFFREF
jgi:hypothetical protein